LKKIIIQILILLFFVAYSGFILYPRTVDMKGKIHTGPDPKTIIWAVTWVQHQLLHDPLNLYRANIYYPHTSALAYSDSFLVESVSVLPFRLFTEEPTILFNIAFWIAFALSGFLMYELAWHLTNNHIISIVAGVFFAFSPYRLDNITHLQYTSHEWLPLIVLSSVLFFLQRKTAWLIGAVAATWLNAMSCGAYMIMSITSLGLLIVLLWIARPLNRRRFAMLVLSGVVLIALLAPFYYQSWKVHSEAGTEVSNRELDIFSVDVLDFAKQPKYMVSPPYSILPEKIKTPYFTMFPGFLASASIIAGILLFFAATGKAGSASEEAQRHLRTALSVSRIAAGIAAAAVAVIFLFYLFLPPPQPITGFNLVSLALWSLIITFFVHALLSAFAYKSGLLDESDLLLRVFIFLGTLNAILCLGPHVYLNNHAVGQNIFVAFHSFMPGFSMVRQVLHFNTFFMLFAVPAAAIALKKLENLPRYTYWAAIAVLFFAVLFEYRTDMGRDYVEVPLEVPAMYQWLAREPEASPYIGLPVWGWPYHPESDRMYWSMYHWKPMVNGLFSYPPKEYEQLVKMTASFPSKESLLYIQRNYTLKYVIVRTKHYSADQLSLLEDLSSQAWSDYKLKKKWDNFWVFENVKWNDKYFYTAKAPSVAPAITHP
jgi:hypothetical protein